MDKPLNPCYEDQQRSDEAPFPEKYVVYLQYKTYMASRMSLRDDITAMRRLKKFFPSLSEEDLLNNSKHYNLAHIFDLVKSYFARDYGYLADDIELSNYYGKTIGSYIFNDKVNAPYIHMDELYESVLLSFFLVMFKWTKHIENIDVYSQCYVYLLYLFNEVCIFGEMQGEDANDRLFHVLAEDMQVLDLAASCYWTVTVFTIAHELGHAYLSHIGKQYTEEHPEKEEFDADSIAYDIALKMIMEKTDDGLLQSYSYLAPMMYMDFFDMYYYTDRVLYKTTFFDSQHPTPQQRKQRLFALVEDEKYDFDTEDGNLLYNGFLDVCQEYKEQTFLKMERGKLDKILRTERRNSMRGTSRNGIA